MKKNVLSVAWVAALLMASTFVHVANAQNAKAPVAWGVENGTVKCLVQPSNLTQRDYASRGTWKTLKGEITLYMANDLGRNGYYDQKPIAELMGEMAGTVDPECVIAAGDIHHFNGIVSLQDPLWMTNYELIYSHPDLMIDWFPVCGNHEYRGNTDAFLHYGQVSRRWMMPAKYYTKVFNRKNTSVRVVFLDTAPLIGKYRNDSETYPDACKEDMQARCSQQPHL